MNSSKKSLLASRMKLGNLKIEGATIESQANALKQKFAETMDANFTQYYEKLEKIGEGQHAVVYKCRHKKT